MAVRSSTARPSRAASDSSGASGTRTMASPSSASRSSCRRMLWNSPSVVTRRGRVPSGSAEMRRTTSSCVFAPRATPPPASPTQAGESLADPVGLGERVIPFVVHEAGGVLPGCGLPLETPVGPCLVRVSGEQEALRHGEPGIVRCEGVGESVEGGGIHWVMSIEVHAPPLGASATSPAASQEFTTEARKTRKRRELLRSAEHSHLRWKSHVRVVTSTILA